MQIEERLKIARKHAGFSQIKLAKTLGMAPRSITGYEKCAKSLSLQLAQKIADICRVNEIWLLTGYGEMTGPPELPSEKITKVIIEHQDLIKKFRDPNIAKEVNEALIELEQLDDDLYIDVVNHIKSSVNAARVIKKSASKKTAASDQDDIQTRKSS